MSCGAMDVCGYVHACVLCDVADLLNKFTMLLQCCYKCCSFVDWCLVLCAYLWSVSITPD